MNASEIHVLRQVFHSPRHLLLISMLSGIIYSFCQVKVQTWVNGTEDSEFVGVGARFGPTIVSKEKHANRTRLSLADPSASCAPPENKVLSFVLVFSSFIAFIVCLQAQIYYYIVRLLVMCC